MFTPLKSLPLLVIFLLHYTRTEPTRSFIATFPSTVIAGTSVQLCIRFQNLHSADIDLTISNPGAPVFDQITHLLTAEQGSETCLSIPIKEQTEHKWNQKITVFGKAIDSDYSFNDSKYFSVIKRNNFNLIETDKPVYKPGQTVRIRILSIDDELRPVSKAFKEIFIEDSSQSRVSQWTEVKTTMGLIDLEMPLSDEPNLGAWTITLSESGGETATQTATFIVKKYVLPKFEASMDHHKKIRFDEKLVEVSVCGMYSYGKKVAGTYKLKAFTTNWRYQVDKGYHEMEDKAVEIVAKNVQNSCHSFQVMLGDLHKTGEYLYKVNFEASVTESDTEIEANVTSSVTVTYDSMKIEVPNLEYYKPGFPIHIKAIVRSIRDEFLPNEKLILTLENSGVAFFNTSVTSNSEGRIDFTFDPKNCELCTNETNKKLASIKMTLRPNDFQVDSSVPHYKQLHNPQVIQYIKPWISKRNSYIQVFPAGNNKLKCGNASQIQIKLRTSVQLSEAEKIHFQFQSRSSFLNTGSFGVSSDGLVQSQIKTKVTLLNKQEINLELIQPTEKKASSFYYNTAGNTVATAVPDLVNFYEYTFEMEFAVTSDMSPDLRILVFFIDGNELIPDHVSLSVEKCLRNRVDIILKKDNINVKQKASISIKSSPMSVCAVSAIDKSVSFMGARNAVRLDEVYEKLNSFDGDSDYNNNYDTYDNQCGEIRGKRRIWYPDGGFPGYSSPYDPTKAFRDSRTVYLSDLKIYRECQRIYTMPRNSKKLQILGRSGFDESMRFLASIEEPMSISTSVSNDETISQQALRNFFPETWLWDIEVTDENGLIEKIEKSPDSITDWLLDAYCLSATEGLGVAETKTLKVFESMFTSMSLPYSVIKGEIFPVKASVFNYARTCLPIQLDLIVDKRLRVQPDQPGKYCVCPGDKITHQFQLEAEATEMVNGLKVGVDVRSINETELCESEGKQVKKIFRFRDIESKYILVEPEGIPKEHVESSFVIFKSEDNLSQQSLKISMPPNVVPGSTRAYLVTTGDAMGPILNNLDNLVQQPTGCGEQNMVKFAPIVSVVNYLRGTSQLTKELDELTKKYLKIGYQRQLTYRHSDSSFSAFGPNGYSKETGGTWLTAFVLSCLSESQASKQIDIDENDLVASFNLLMSRQDQDGSFRQEGAKLFSSALAGGLKKDQKTALSAYVLISLVKASKAVSSLLTTNKEQLDTACEYLKSSLSNHLAEADTYTLALVYYAFKIYQFNEEYTQLVDEELERRSVNANGFKYWTETSQQSSGSSSKSADLEISAYILLGKLYQAPNNSQVISITKWINSQRNSLGGFYSTQDTVIALEALSKFATGFYTSKISMKGVTRFNGVENVFGVDDTNRLLNQKVKLDSFSPIGTNEVTFSVSGYGTVLLQLVAKYNVMKDNVDKPSNDFEFGIFPKRSVYGSRCLFTSLLINAKYIGEKEASNMAMVSVKLPSGWVPVEESIERLKSTAELKRYELAENVAVLYFDQIGKEGLGFSFDAQKKFEIENRKPGLISVYDYYESVDQAITQPFEIDDVCNGQR